MKFLGKAAAMVSAAAVAVSMSAAPALAATSLPTFDPPTSQTSTIQNNERLLTAIGAHGSAVVGEYVGLSEQINQSYATPGNGVNTENYVNNPYFGIYGTDANQNPDPYAANLFYKWYLTANGMTEQANAVTDYMYNYLFDGYHGSCITSDTKSVKDGTSIALSGRPDVIVTQDVDKTSGESKLEASKANWTEQIKAINNFKTSGSKYYKEADDHYVGDENYNPQFAGYSEVTTPGFIDSVYNAADAAQAAYNYSWSGTGQEAKVNLRYGYDDAQVTAQNYERYTKGTDLYILSKLAQDNKEKKTVAYVTSITGKGASATFEIQGNLNPLKSGESNGHTMEPLNATCVNLANELDPDLAVNATPGATTTATVDQLATADVIVLTKPDNMAYNFGIKDSYSGVKTDSLQGAVEGNVDSDGNTIDNGEQSTRHYGDIATGHFKNNFYGPTEINNTLVSNIKDALEAGGHKTQANRAILSCVMENASNCDGGSVDSMALHGVINGFAYPEYMNPLEQFGYYLNTMAHIKTVKVPEMVQKLAQDMTLPNGISMSSINSYKASTAKTIEMQEDQGFLYYKQHKAEIDEKYPQLTPSDRFTMPTSKTIQSLQTRIAQLKKQEGASTGIAKGKTATVSGITYKATSASAVTVSKGANKKSVTIPAKVTIKGKSYNVTGIASKAFKSSKATTLTVKSTKFTKKSVKNSLKSSKVKTVKVPKAKKAAYKKIFTKANAGKKVTVK